ncbi:hypothetical protein PC112_g7564 [Phytophthora cactorum]|nr:hypothetical protein PC112_g7564 [Phytophthora cactorum]
MHGRKCSSRVSAAITQEWRSAPTYYRPSRWSFGKLLETPQLPLDMTGSGFCNNPFSAIALSSSDDEELQGVVKTILDANFDRYLHFTDVNPNAWKLIKGKDGMQVYSNRPRRQHPHTVRVDESELQSLLCVGSVPGTLDDIMHSVQESAVGVKHQSVNASSDAVLLRIKAPTALDPFATVVVKWMELDSTFKSVSVGKVKKFAQTLGKRYTELDKRRSLNSDQNCVTCTKRVGRLAKLASRHNTCMVCCGSICNACKIEKKQKLVTADLKVTIKKVAFCFSCLTDVMTANESQYSFAEDSDGDAELHRPVYHSVWTTRLPSWSSTKSSESCIDFASTR